MNHYCINSIAIIAYIRTQTNIPYVTYIRRSLLIYHGNKRVVCKTAGY